MAGCVSSCYGGHSVEETPGSIPNPEAKLDRADGTALGRVWESRSPPDIFHREWWSAGTPSGCSPPPLPFVMPETGLARQWLRWWAPGMRRAPAAPSGISEDHPLCTEGGGAGRGPVAVPPVTSRAFGPLRGRSTPVDSSVVPHRPGALSACRILPGDRSELQECHAVHAAGCARHR